MARQFFTLRATDVFGNPHDLDDAADYYANVSAAVEDAQSFLLADDLVDRIEVVDSYRMPAVFVDRDEVIRVG